MDLSVKKIKRVVAFDFDDTLAITDSLIGITTDLPIDLSQALESFGVSYREKKDEYLWIDSCNYEKLESSSAIEELKIRFDYCQTLSLNVHSAKPIFPMIRAMQKAASDPETKVIVVTARAGYAKIWSESLGREVSATNREKITDFLRAHNIEVPDEDLHTVGDISEVGGDTAIAKAGVLMFYATKHPYAKIVFYDDSERNFRAASRMHKFYGIRNPVVVHKVKNGSIIKTKRLSHKIGIKQRLNRIFKCMLE